VHRPAGREPENDVQLHVLHLGDVRCDKGFNFTPGYGDGEVLRVPVPAYLIETDSGQRVLVDTGLHEVHIDDPEHTFAGSALGEVIRPEMTYEHRLEHQLGLLGLSVPNITHVINTHLHFDHCGQNHLFTEVPILVQRHQYECATHDPGWPTEYFARPELEYVLLDGEEEIFPGVRTFVAPGHAPGFMALLVELDGGRVLLCGDAIPLEENLTRDLWTAFADPAEARASAYRLLRVAQATRARMLYGHDTAQWELLPKAPLGVGCG
jgi:N-acyl homoserine lactone hydrolase